MRLIALAESPADEAAIRILTEAIRGTALAWVDPPKWRSQGWPAVLEELPVVIRDIHFHSDATGLVVVVDTNSSPLHAPAHIGQPHPKCRICALRTRANLALANLPPIPGRPSLRVALGAATPAINLVQLRTNFPSGFGVLESDIGAL